MRDRFIQRLAELAKNDPSILLITGDLGFGVLNEYRERFPDQFINAGVAEQNMTGLATGLALEGYKVYTYSIANFVFMRCLEQIRNDAAYHDCNVNVVCVGGGMSYGQLGISHHATEDLAIMRSLPGVVVVAPGDDWEAGEATAAVAAHPGVSYLRLDRVGAESGTDTTGAFKLGKARTVREGTDAAIIATGGMLGEAVAAAGQLAEQGIHCRVVSLHTLSPLDTETLLQAGRETGGILTVEEHTVDGGLGGCVAETLLENGVTPGFFQRLGLRGGFASAVGSQSYLRQRYGIDRTAITAAIEQRVRARQSIAA
ncbi:MAG: transketolase C-terminal domain-containing protein [Planctomycetota bacterium]